MKHSFELKDKQSQRVFQQFLRQLNRELRVLPADDQEDIRKELVYHLYENMQHQNMTDELEALLNAIEQFGELEDMVKPLVADRLAEVAGKKFRPRLVVQSIARNIGRSGAKTVLFSLLAVLYVFALSFIIPGILKIFNPDIGLYRTADGYFYGLPEDPNLPELLGYWVVPLSIVLTIILYILNTRLMRWVSKNG